MKRREIFIIFYYSGVILVAGIFVHILIRVFLIRGLEKVASATTTIWMAAWSTS